MPEVREVSQASIVSGVCFWVQLLSNKFIYFYIVFNGDAGVSGDHENSVKTHKNGESNFHLKRGSIPGPTKQSRAFPAERDHREGRLAQHVTKD